MDKQNKTTQAQAQVTQTDRNGKLKPFTIKDPTNINMVGEPNRSRSEGWKELVDAVGSHIAETLAHAYGAKSSVKAEDLVYGVRVPTQHHEAYQASGVIQLTPNDRNARKAGIPRKYTGERGDRRNFFITYIGDDPHFAVYLSPNFRWYIRLNISETEDGHLKYEGSKVVETTGYLYEEIGVPNVSSQSSAVANTEVYF